MNDMIETVYSTPEIITEVCEGVSNTCAQAIEAVAELAHDHPVAVSVMTVAAASTAVGVVILGCKMIDAAKDGVSFGIKRKNGSSFFMGKPICT